MNRQLAKDGSGWGLVLWLIGYALGGRHLVVSYTERNGRIRLISARQMTPRERRAYEQ